MPIDLNNFLHSFARHMAARAGAFVPATEIAYAGVPRSLWLWGAIEADSEPLYSVLRIYGGPSMVKHPLPRYSVQCQTVGPLVTAAVSRAQTLFEALLEDDGQPLRMQQIGGYTLADDAPDGGYKLVGVDPVQRPGLIGRDERGRAMVVFNFDVGFFKTA